MAVLSILNIEYFVAQDQVLPLNLLVLSLPSYLGGGLELLVSKLHGSVN